MAGNPHDPTPDHAGHHGVGHIVPVKILISTGLALLILTVITVWVAKIDLGAANIFVALLVAAFKASLVVLFFMHLRYDRPFHSFIFVASVCFVMLFISFALTDSVEYENELIEGDAPLVQELITTAEASAE